MIEPPRRGGPRQVADAVVQIEQHGRSQRTDVLIALPVDLLRKFGLFCARLGDIVLRHRFPPGLFRDLPLAVRIGPLLFGNRASLLGVLRLNRGGDHARRQRKHHQRGGRQGHPLAPGELLQPIRPSVPFGRYRPAAAVIPHIVRQLLHRRISPLRALANGGRRDGVKFSGLMRWIVFADGPHHLVRRLPSLPEWMLAGDQFVEQDAQREHVRRRGHRAAFNLLRTAVLRRQDQRTRHLRFAVRAFYQLGDAEVEQFHGAGRRHQYVVRLQVAMHRQVAVSVPQGIADLQKQLQPAVLGKRVTAAELRNRHSVDVFHHEVRIAVGGLPSVQNGGDVRVIQLRQNFALPVKAAQELRIDSVAAHHFDSGLPLEASVGARGQVHHAHASGGQTLLNAVRPDRIALG